MGVQGDKDALSAAKCLCVFGEVDVDSPNVYAEARSCECVVVVEDSREGVDGLALVVVEGAEVLLITDLDDIGLGESAAA